MHVKHLLMFLSFFLIVCACTYALINDCVCIQIHVWMQTVSWELICGSLISLIHQRHMDSGVEKENSVMVASEEDKRKG